MDLRLLGPVELRLGDGPVELGPRKQRAVLAMLALRAGRTVPTDALIEGLWGEEPPATAAKMVQLYISHLRPMLNGDSGAQIVTRDRGYQLRLADGEVDAARFERLLEGSRAREALALWHGDALEDVAGEPFAAAEIRRLDDLRLRATEMAIDADLAAGRHAAAISELAPLVAEHPLRENLHRQRMLALYRDGRQSEALAAYQDARTALVEQIGVEPGAELRALHEAVLGQDPALDLPGSAGTRSGAGTATAAAARRPRRLLVAAAAVSSPASLRSASSGYSSPKGCPASARTRWRHRPEQLSHHRAVPGRPRSGRRSPPAPARCGWRANSTGPSRGSTARTSRSSTIPVGGEPDALAFGARLAVGGRRRWARRRPDRSRIQQGPAADRGRERAEVAGGGGAARYGWSPAPTAACADRDPPRRFAPDLPRREGDRCCRRRRSDLGDERGGGDRHPHRSRSGAVVTSVNVGNGPTAVATGEGAVWVVNRGDGTLSRVNPATNAVSGTVHVGADPRAVAAGQRPVWVAGGEEGIVAASIPAAGVC